MEYARQGEKIECQKHRGNVRKRRRDTYTHTYTHTYIHTYIFREIETERFREIERGRDSEKEVFTYICIYIYTCKYREKRERERERERPQVNGALRFGTLGLVHQSSSSIPDPHNDAAARPMICASGDHPNGQLLWLVGTELAFLPLGQQPC